MQAIWTVVCQTALQFVYLFGVFILAGMVLTVISRWTSNACRQFVLPDFGTYVFGFIGVPVHEFSHALFCKLFLHEVREVKWFDPKAKGGSHGSVTHEYDPWNLYHRMGHFFIGLAPVILGPLLLGALYAFLVPGSMGVVEAGVKGARITPLLEGFVTTLTSVRSVHAIGFWIFLYLGICVSSQMELSIEDLKQAAQGLFPLALALLIANSIAALFDLSWHTKLIAAGGLACKFGLGLFALATTLSLFNLLLCVVIFSLVNKICGREAVNPFRG